MLNAVMVEYYGTPTPLNQVANINTPDGRTLSIQPWEKAFYYLKLKRVSYKQT